VACRYANAVGGPSDAQIVQLLSRAVTGALLGGRPAWQWWSVTDAGRQRLGEALEGLAAGDPARPESDGL
jgi:hypothetical protein